MRRRLERFLPIVVLALVVQILAPIAACWATAVAMADPLQTASICHTSEGNGSDRQDRQSLVHDGLCAMCASHAGASIDAPRTHAIAARQGRALTVLWPEASAALTSGRIGSNTQARGPPPSA